MHKIHNGLVPTAVKYEFNASIFAHNHNIHLQKKGNYYFPRAKTSYGQKILGLEELTFRQIRILHCNLVHIKKKTENSAYSNLQCLIKIMRTVLEKSVAMIDLFYLMCLSIKSLKKHIRI